MANTYRVCQVDTCESKHDSHGYCGLHMAKFRRHGSAIGPYKPKVMAKLCAVEGCEYMARRYGHCSTHYKWKQRTGDASVRPPKAEWFKRSPKNKKAKYKYVSVKNHPILGTGQFMEHRVVMTDYLGRKLLSSENVHHINGDGMDNRLENLELWIVWQPPGQRLEDKVDWAMELLRQYKPEVLKEGV